MVTEAYSLIRQTGEEFVQCLNRRHRALRMAIFIPSEFDYLLSSPCQISFFPPVFFIIRHFYAKQRYGALLYTIGVLYYFIFLFYSLILLYTVTLFISDSLY